jgi:hypothetical protein
MKNQRVLCSILGSLVLPSAIIEGQIPRGLLKKNLWMPPALAEQLRETAFRLRISEAELSRRGLEKVL